MSSLLNYAVTSDQFTVNSKRAEEKSARKMRPAPEFLKNIFAFSVYQNMTDFCQKPPTENVSIKLRFFIFCYLSTSCALKTVASRNKSHVYKTL